MTGKDLFIAMGNISPKYYEEAENVTIAFSQGHKSLRRPLLIAAVIALTLLLVGCAVVYALRLQDMSIGKETYTQQFADDGRAMEPTEKTRDIITLYGHSGDPVQLAMKEWYEYLQAYDPDTLPIFGASKVPEREGHGYEYPVSFNTSNVGGWFAKLVRGL